MPAPGLQTNITDVNTGPGFAIFPVHGGRGVESRLTVEGMNISNPPGGNQPPNYTADIGNAAEVSITTSGGLGESETGGAAINIIPRTGASPMPAYTIDGFASNTAMLPTDPVLKSLSETDSQLEPPSVVFQGRCGVPA